MDAPKPYSPLLCQKVQRKFLETKEYEIPYQGDTYKLIMTTFPEETINFDIRQTNNITYKYYQKEYTFKDIANTLILPQQLYNNITKVLKYLDKEINNKDLIIKKEKNDNGVMQIVLTIKKQIDYEIFEIKIIIDEKEINQHDMIRILIEEINNIKKSHTNIIPNQNIAKDNNNDPNHQKKLEEKIKQLEEKLENQNKEIIKIKQERAKEQKETQQLIKELNKKIQILLDNNNDNQKYIDIIKEKEKQKQENNKKIEEENKKVINNIQCKEGPFNENPEFLKYKKGKLNTKKNKIKKTNKFI